MFQRYSFIIVFSCLITGLMWWSRQVESSLSVETVGPKPASAVVAPAADPENRRDLLEALDRIVAYEHYYRSVYGRFTQILSRVGYSVPGPLAEVYEIRVVEASRDRLLVNAFSEENGRISDQVTVDQDFVVHASFPLPEPRVEYLKAQALKHLRALRDAPPGQILEEQGIFRGRFRYEVSRDSEGRRVISAVGVQAPVTGVQLELGTAQDEPLEMAAATGEKPVQNVMTTMEETYLAQRIFRGETGRYAKNWSELSKVAHFRFEGKEQYGGESVPFGDSGSVLDLDAAVQDRQNSPPVPGSELEIEPIVSDKTQ